MLTLDRFKEGRTDLVFDLVEEGLSADSTDSRGVSMLQWCAYYGDVSSIRFLISRGAELASLGRNFDLTGAAFHGHWQLCQFLIESGSDPNSPIPETGETPLHSATCRPGLFASDLVVQVLLGAGAKPNHSTIPGADTGDFMRDGRTKGESPLHRAAAFGSARMIQLLIDAGANIQALDATGDSPLSWASWHARPDSILRQLLFGNHHIHPDRDSASDHGLGVSAMERFLKGKPLPRR